MLTPLYQSVILSDKPSAYWTFGELSGTSAFDSSGNGLTGTYENGVTLNAVVGPIINNPLTAPEFNGSTQYVSVPNNALLNPGDTFTLEAWVYPTGTSSYILSKGVGGYGLIVSDG